MVSFSNAHRKQILWGPINHAERLVIRIQFFQYGLDLRFPVSHRHNHRRRLHTLHTTLIQKPLPHPNLPSSSTTISAFLNAELMSNYDVTSKTGFSPRD